MAPKYSTLNVKKAEIRVLHLLPGVDPKPIRCTLEVVSLNDKPEFEALSYVWGDAKVQREVSVDGYATSVTFNLEAALRALRKKEEVHTVWADALCINQIDIAEKNTQVPLIGRVYSEASSVVAWLGESDADIDLAIEWSLKLDENEVQIELYSDTHYEKLMRGFRSISLRPYWKRMWTFQECLLPKRTPILLCGKLKISLDQLEKRRALAAAANKKLAEAGKCQAMGSDMGFLIAMDAIKSENWRENRFGLMELLYFTLVRECHDPRDHIYALYGMAPDVAVDLPPDYNRPPRQVMHDTMVYFVRREFKAPERMFLWFCLHEDRLQETDTPSWVPDFSKSLLTSTSPDQYWSVRSLSTHFTNDCALELSADARVLKLKAYSLGKCKVVERFGHSAEQVLHQVKQIMASMKQFSQVNEEISSEYISCLMRTVLAHNVFLVDKPMAEILGQISESENLHGISDDLRRNFSRLKGQTLFQVPSHGLGISVACAEDGDVIVASPSLRRPFLLRPQNRHSGETTCRLVGFAYVDGIMDNDGLATAWVEEIMQQELEEFNIE